VSSRRGRRGEPAAPVARRPVSGKAAGRRTPCSAASARSPVEGEARFEMGDRAVGQLHDVGLARRLRPRRAAPRPSHAQKIDARTRAVRESARLALRRCMMWTAIREEEASMGEEGAYALFCATVDAASAVAGISEPSLLERIKR